MTEKITESQIGVLKRTTKNAFFDYWKEGRDLWVSAVHDVRKKQIEKLDEAIADVEAEISNHSSLTVYVSNLSLFFIKIGWMKRPVDPFDPVLEGLNTDLRRLKRRVEIAKNGKCRELKRYEYGFHEEVYDINQFFTGFNMKDVEMVFDNLILDGYSVPLSTTLGGLLTEIDKSGKQFVEGVKNEIEHYRESIKATEK